MNKMREIRRSKKLTMKELGNLVGVSESTISLYETGKHEPDIITMGRIADALSVSVDVLLGRDPGIKKEPATAGGQSVEKYLRLNPENRRKIDELIALYLTAQSADQPPPADPE